MWKDIEEINWAERSKQRRGYEQAKRFILENFTPKRIKEIDEFISARHNDLYKRIEEYEREVGTRCGDYGGDDSFGDMINHAIGLGQEYFESVMADPTLLNDLDFVESFTYCIPYEDEYEILTDGYHQKRAVNALVELVRILQENRPSDNDKKIITDLIIRFANISNGDYKKALTGFSHKTYSKYYEFEANDCSAMFSNYLSDCKKFKL